MTQTRIDQFYKVTHNNREATSKIVRRGSVKTNTARSPNLSSSTLGKKKKKGLLSRKAKASLLHGKDYLASSCKINGKRQVASRKTSLGVEETRSSDANNTSTKTMEVKTSLLTSPTGRQTSPVKNRQRTPYSGSKYIPKTPSPIKNSLDRSPRHTNTARRRLFKDKTEELMSVAIDNLNLVKEGAISTNDVDLEKTYSSGIFNYKYNPIDTTASTRYDINDLVIPTGVYSMHFFLVIATVFSKPINCGYFDEDELDLIFSLLMLSRPAQELLIRMLKRKLTWHRIDNIKYNGISDNLRPIFDELVSRSMFKSSMEEEDIAVLLNLLQVDEIRKLCQESKIRSNGKKEDHIRSIMKFCSTTKSLFPGMPSPATKLRASVNRILGCCVLLNARVKQMVDRIITLLMPNRDPTETLADVFLTILRVETNEIKFPEVSVSDFPIFANRGHLLDYVEAKSALSDTLNAIEKKRWHITRDLGSLAMERLSLFLEVEGQSLKNSTLPSYIRRFMPGYMWLKVLSTSIDAFKKTKETLPQAIESLRMLIEQDCHMKNRKGQWYNDLIKIEMCRRKNLDSSVMLLSNAVSQLDLTEVDKLDLLDRAQMLMKRKSNISQTSKATVKSLVENELSKTQLTPGTSTIIIEGTLCVNIAQRRSTWCINNGIDKTYMNVENLALHHYKRKGYPKGVHCEGAFPVTLFGILFWKELYSMDIPGAYVSLYQDAPIDLFSLEFYENRKEQIDQKLQIMRKFDSETISLHLKREFDVYCEFNSICQGNIFNDSNSLQEIAFCLGVEGIVGICERMIHNFLLWRAGFPDLIVWNPCTRQCKIVEVKGPNDTLSTKQKLWLQYLNHLGLDTEVCYCKSDSKGGHKRKHEAVT